MVISAVDFKVASTREKKQQSKRLFSQLSEKDNGFMIGQSNQDEQTESRDNMKYRGISSDKISNPTQVNYPQVDVHTPEKNIVSKVRSEVDNMMTTVENRVQHAVLTAIENLVTLRMELVMKSANALSGRSVDDNVLEPDHWDFSGKSRPTNHRFE